MKRFVFFLLGILSAMALTIALVRHPDEDGEEILDEDKDISD